MKTKYYKVVYCKDGILYSCIKSNELKGSPGFKQQFSIQYELDKWVYPNVIGSDLLCFTCLDTAKDFARNDLRINAKVFECKVKNPREIGVFLPLSQYYDIEYKVKRVQELRNKHKKISHLFRKSWYLNTTFCSAIKLIKQIE